MADELNEAARVDVAGAGMTGMALGILDVACDAIGALNDVALAAARGGDFDTARLAEARAGELTARLRAAAGDRP